MIQLQARYSDDINHEIYVMTILNAAQSKMILQKCYISNINGTKKNIFQLC